MDGWMERRMDGWMDGGRDGWMYGRMDGRTDGWMDGRMFVCMLVMCLLFVMYLHACSCVCCARMCAYTYSLYIGCMHMYIYVYIWIHPHACGTSFMHFLGAELYDAWSIRIWQGCASRQRTKNLKPKALRPWASPAVCRLSMLQYWLTEGGCAKGTRVLR